MLSILFSFLWSIYLNDQSSDRCNNHEDGQDSGRNCNEQVGLVATHEFVVEESRKSEGERRARGSCDDLDEYRDVRVDQKCSADCKGDPSGANQILAPVLALGRLLVVREDEAFDDVKGRAQLHWVREEKIHCVEDLKSICCRFRRRQVVKDSNVVRLIPVSQDTVLCEDDVQHANASDDDGHKLHVARLIFDDFTNWHNDSNTFECKRRVGDRFWSVFCEGRLDRRTFLDEINCRESHDRKHYDQDKDVAKQV